jgi:hypothetical protein
MTYLIFKNQYKTMKQDQDSGQLISSTDGASPLHSVCDSALCM